MTQLRIWKKFFKGLAATCLSFWFIRLLMVLQTMQDMTGSQLKSEYDNYMEFLMVASQQMAGDVIVLMVLVIVRSKSVEAFSPNGNEPAPLTSEVLAAQYLHDS
jgi:hypothetical protein